MVGVPSSLSLSLLSLSLTHRPPARVTTARRKLAASVIRSRWTSYYAVKQTTRAPRVDGRLSLALPLALCDVGTAPALPPRGVCVHVVGRPRLPDRSSLGRMTRISNEPPSSRCLSLSPNLLYTRMTLPPRPRRKNGRRRSCPFYCSSSCGFLLWVRYLRLPLPPCPIRWGATGRQIEACPLAGLRCGRGPLGRERRQSLMIWLGLGLPAILVATDAISHLRSGRRVVRCG